FAPEVLRGRGLRQRGLRGELPADPHELVEVVESGGVLRIVGGLELRAVPRAIEHGLDELPDVRDGVLASRVIASVQLGAELVEEPDEPGDRLDGPRGQQRYLP